MDEPKIVQIDCESTTVYNTVVTVWGALREDGSVVWMGDNSRCPSDWHSVNLPEHDGVVVQVSVSCTVRHDTLHPYMSLLYDDGSVAYTYPYLYGVCDSNWSFITKSTAHR